MKTTSGSSYPIYIAGTDGDVNITIKKVPSIKEISVDEQKLPFRLYMFNRNCH